MICNVLEYLENAKEKFPQKIAFGDVQKSISYQEVEETAKRIGSGILSEGIASGPIVVLADRDVESLLAFFGIVYVAVMLSYVYQIRVLKNGVYLAFLVFICSWGCDTCAYCVGKTMGKHKMAPVLSPKKSVEGAVGGVLGTALLTVLYAFIFRVQMGLEVRGIIVLAVISAVAGLISMVGDLTASAIKRNYDIKDYGTLIPGHGGIMDRFDSMMITAPIIYYLAVYFL